MAKPTGLKDPDLFIEVFIENTKPFWQNQNEEYRDDNSSSIGRMKEKQTHKREKTTKGYEITLCEGFPTVKIGTTKIGVYLKIQFYNNISITDIMYSQACSHTLKLLKAINEDVIEYGQER